MLSLLASQLRATPGMASPSSSMRHRPSNKELMTSSAALLEAVWGSREVTFCSSR